MPTTRSLTDLTTGLPAGPPSRRALLASAAAATGIAVTGCSQADQSAAAQAVASQRSAGDSTTPTFVLVGGSAAPSFYWMPLVRELSLLGHRSHPVELPAHGLDAGLPASYQAPQDTASFTDAPSPVAGKTLDDYAAAVTEVVRAVAAHGPVVLVGHSQGGPIVTRAADSVHDQIACLVYISAIAVTPAGSALATFASPSNAASLAATVPSQGGDPASTGITRSNLRTADAGYLDAHKAAVMHDVPEEQFLAAINYLQQPGESVLPTLEDLAPSAERWGSVPRTFVKLTADRWHTPALQDQLIAEADAVIPANTFDVVELDSSHAGFIVTQPAELAGVLVSTATT